MATAERTSPSHGLSLELQSLLAQLSADDGSQINALKQLSELGSSLALFVPALVQTLEDASSNLRVGAAVALGAVGGAAAVPVLILALGDEDRELSHFATKSLINIGLPAVEALTKVLSDEDVNIEAMCVLGKLDPSISKAAVPALEEQLDAQSATGSPLKFITAAALAQASGINKPGWQKGADVLRHGICGPEAFQAMGALRFVPTSAAVPSLLEVVQGGGEELRRESMDALECIGKEAVPPLLQALDDSESGGRPEVFNSICEVLARLGQSSSEAVPMLMQKMFSGTTAQRCAALRVLGNVGEEALPVVPMLSHMVEDDALDKEVRDCATEALHKLGAASMAS